MQCTNVFGVGSVGSGHEEGRTRTTQGRIQLDHNVHVQVALLNQSNQYWVAAGT